MKKCEKKETMHKLFNKTQYDLSNLQTDLHSHLIPGIDDGAQDMSESISLIRQLYELGYRKIITTPHIRSDYFPNTSSIIRGGLEKVRVALEENNISIQLEAGAEYRVDPHFEELIDKEDLLTFGDKYILVEMSYRAEPINFDVCIFKLQTKGYKPILAHPERYLYYSDRINDLLAKREKGVLFQMNLGSLAGHYSDKVQAFAKKLLKLDMVDILGTDLHYQPQLDTIKAGLSTKLMQKALSREYFNSKL